MSQCKLLVIPFFYIIFSAAAIASGIRFQSCYLSILIHENEWRRKRAAKTTSEQRRQRKQDNNNNNNKQEKGAQKPLLAVIRAEVDQQVDLVSQAERVAPQRGAVAAAAAAGN